MSESFVIDMQYNRPVGMWLAWRVREGGINRRSIFLFKNKLPPRGRTDFAKMARCSICVAMRTNSFCCRSAA
jgi:hypothetical protein